MKKIKKQRITTLYRAYLIGCLVNDIDTKVDNYPVSHEDFVKQLKKSKKSVIIRKNT